MKKIYVFLIVLCASLLGVSNAFAAAAEDPNAGHQGACSDPKMPVLARKNNCTACHEVDRNCVGPAWKNVALRYKGESRFTYIDTISGNKEFPLEEGLVRKVSKGGSGAWGTMPMPPNDPAGLRKEDMKALVKYILSLDK